MTSQPSQKVEHLNRYYHFTELMRDPSIEGHLLRYDSQYDRTRQSVLILKPVGHKSDKLFFFFHGMDGDSGDAVVVRDLVTRMKTTVVAPGGRGPSWLSTAFMSDAEQVIRDYLEGFDGGYLIGVSMGGTQVLALAGLIHDDLRPLIHGVIALIPGADLPAILERSTNERVKCTLRDSVTEDISLLRQRSPTNIIDKYPSGLPFIIFHKQDDTLLLADELLKFIATLRRRHHPVTTFSAPGGHEFTYKDFDYAEVLGKLGNDSTEYRVPLRSNEH